MEPPSANTVLLTVLAASTAIKSVLDYKQKEAAKKQVQHVAETLKTTGDATSKVLGEIHTLVNSDWGKQLRAYALMARSSANLLRRDPAASSEQIALADRMADEADRISASHDSKQADIDAAKQQGKQ